MVSAPRSACSYNPRFLSVFHEASNAAGASLALGFTGSEANGDRSHSACALCTAATGGRERAAEFGPASVPRQARDSTSWRVPTCCALAENLNSSASRLVESDYRGAGASQRVAIVRVHQSRVVAGSADLDHVDHRFLQEYALVEFCAVIPTAGLALRLHSVAFAVHVLDVDTFGAVTLEAIAMGVHRRKR
eukprot:scaffold159168_cov35-Tisochrysis_lutea.AAC.3